MLRWTEHPHSEVAQSVIDAHRLTEDGAEAVALAFVHALSKWTVQRRVQRDGYADWLLKGPTHQKMALALEVSGTDDGGAAARLREKREQVAKNAEANCVCAAGVVRFAAPQILAATAAGARVP